MSEQMDGERLKEEGMGLALSREDIPPWRERFEKAVFDLPLGTRFTSEDVVESYGVGLPSGEVGTNINNAVGAVMNAIAKTGAMVDTGLSVKARRRNSHSARLTLWQRS